MRSSLALTVVPLYYTYPYFFKEFIPSPREQALGKLK